MERGDRGRGRDTCKQEGRRSRERGWGGIDNVRVHVQKCMTVNNNESYGEKLQSTSLNKDKYSQ